MKVYESKFVEIQYDEKANILINIWFDTTTHMTYDEYKPEMLVYASKSTEFKPRGLLIDALHFNFVQDLELQAWMAENVIKPDIRNGVKKYAVLLPEGIFEQVSIQQTIDEGRDVFIDTQYFSDKESAYKWITE